MRGLGTARRVILSIGVPALVVTSAYQLEFRLNERTVSADDGFAGALAAAFRGGDATIYDTFAPRDEWWFWPAAVALTTLWLWVLWPAAARTSGGESGEVR